MSDLTRILHAVEQGDSAAAEQLLPLVYEELRKLAAARMAGTWNNLATNTAPASGLIEFQDTSPLPGQAFYRVVQP